MIHNCKLTMSHKLNKKREIHSVPLARSIISICLMHRHGCTPVDTDFPIVGMIIKELITSANTPIQGKKQYANLKTSFE